MRILLDTHTFLWFALGDAKLSNTARTHIEDPANDKLVSPASYWEIAIKISLRKYTLPQSYTDFIRKAIDGNGFTILPVEPKHTAELIDLPFHHRDPFDRLMIAQAMVEQIGLVSGDSQFDAYPVTRIW